MKVPLNNVYEKKIRNDAKNYTHSEEVWNHVYCQKDMKQMPLTDLL